MLELLDHIVESGGREQAVALLERQYQGLATRLAAAVDGVRGPARGEAVARALAVEGYLATFEPDGSGGGELVERHCPHRLVAERFPEVCAAEQRVLATVLEASVTRHCRIAGGCGTCSYTVEPITGPTQEKRSA